jgi:O-acetyl-ADP-ribose deacetylase (regulator of RNase III)
MTQSERRIYLIKALLKEQPQYSNMQIPKEEQEQKNLLRSLFNIRYPKEASLEFLNIQNEYLQEETEKKGVTFLENLTPIKNNIYLWQGDITTLKCDAIVNAANSQMLGCFYPCHSCIDNAIHTYAGVQLRFECNQIMEAQGEEEPTGTAKITKAYNLPCKYVIHTVGPIVGGRLKSDDCEKLAACYKSCLDLAVSNGIKSISFCCISTGEFHFPNEKAAEIAIKTVTDFQKKSSKDIKVIFNVFKDLDYEIYKNLLK